MLQSGQSLISDNLSPHSPQKTSPKSEIKPQDGGLKYAVLDSAVHYRAAKHFSDNLIITIFRAVLVYDLLYSSFHNGIALKYGFLEIPMIFLCLLIGLTLMISLFKYVHLYNKLILNKK